MKQFQLQHNQQSFPFDELCGCCRYFGKNKCQFKNQADTLIRWKSLNCKQFKSVFE